MADLKKIFGKKTYSDGRIERYESILQQSSNSNPDLHFKLGRLYQNEKEVIEAVKHYEAAAQQYLQAEDYLGAVVTFKIISLINPEDQDALASFANIEFQYGIKLTEQVLKKFIDERGETVAPSKKSDKNSEPAVKSRSWADAQRERKKEAALQEHNVQFNSERQQLLDLIAGNDESPVSLPPLKKHQSAASVPDDEPLISLDAPGESADTTIDSDGGFLIDLSQKDASSSQDHPTQDTVKEIVFNSPLFAQLSDEEKHMIVRQRVVRSYDEDATIMRYPSEQKELFMVVTGEAYLVKESDGNGSRSSVIQVNSGECWGEHTLFAQMKTCAFSVMASNGTSVLEISQVYVKELTQKHQVFFEQLKGLCERRWCQNALSIFPLFGELSVDEQQQLLPLFSEVTIREGEVIIHEGDGGKSMFLITSGDVEVYTTLVEEGDVQVVQAGKSLLFLAKLRAGDCFGEGAFFTNEPRNATVQAITETTLLKLADGHLTRLLQEHPLIAEKLQQYHEKRLQETMKILQHAL